MEFKKYRVANNYTQSEIADKIGIPVRTYQNYEYELYSPPSDVLKALALTYHCTIDELLGYDPEDTEIKPQGKAVLLLDSFYELDEEWQIALIAIAQTLAKVHKRSLRPSIGYQGVAVVLSATEKDNHLGNHYHEL